MAHLVAYPWSRFIRPSAKIMPSKRQFFLNPVNKYLVMRKGCLHAVQCHEIVFVWNWHYINKIWLDLTHPQCVCSNIFKHPSLSLLPAFLFPPPLFPLFSTNAFCAGPLAGLKPLFLTPSGFLPQVKDLYHLGDSAWSVCKWWTCALTDCCPLSRSSWWKGGHVVQFLPPTTEFFI